MARRLGYALTISIAILLNLCAGEVTISFCGNSNKGEWRERLPEYLLEVPFTAEDETCDGIDDNQYAILVNDPFGKSEILSRPVNKLGHGEFFAWVVSKLASERITYVSDSLELAMKKVHEAVVAYMQTDSPNAEAFHKAVITPSLPKEMKVFQVLQKNLLPDSVQRQVQNNIHVWVVTDGKWSHLTLPNKETEFQEILHHLIVLFNKLQHPLKVAYDSPQTYSVYKRERFHLFTVYHHTKQLNEVYRTIVDPLVNVFRPYFAFITYDIDTHPLPSDINKSGPFPYIVTQAVGQKNGVHIISEYTPYTTENLKNILQSIIDPNVNNAEAVHPSPAVTRVSASTFEKIVEHDEPVVAALCGQGTPECDTVEDKMHKAAMSLEKVEERYQVVLYLVECSSVKDISLVEVPHLPYIIIKDDMNEWSLYSDTLVVTAFIRAIQIYGKSVEGQEKAEDRSSNSIDSPGDYYDSFSELVEDDPVALKFPQFLVVPSSLPILTTDNYTSFINQNENCLIAFYLPYCMKCKPMLYHLMNTTSQMKEAGMPTAVVNCADYPDVCEMFEVVLYPTIKYRKGSSGGWITYEGVLSDVELLKRTNNEQLDKEASILEITPTLLLKIMKGDGLMTLPMLVSVSITPDLERAFSGVKKYQIYWLNSTRYSELSKVLLDTQITEPPAFVWADYTKHSIHRLDMRNSPTQQLVETFVNDIVNGNRESDGKIFEKKWKPLSGPIVFPSARFLGNEDPQGGGHYHYIDREDEDADDDEEEEHDEYPPVYHDSYGKGEMIDDDAFPDPSYTHRHVHEEL